MVIPTSSSSYSPFPNRGIEESQLYGKIPRTLKFIKRTFDRDGSVIYWSYSENVSYTCRPFEWSGGIGNSQNFASFRAWDPIRKAALVNLLRKTRNRYTRVFSFLALSVIGCSLSIDAKLLFSTSIEV